MSRVEDPVFAMAESFFLDGGGRLDDVEIGSLTPVSEGDLLPLRMPMFPT